MTAQDSSVTKCPPEARVCSAGHLPFIDNALRPLIHSPRKLFGPYVKSGFTCLDIGCGGGFASMGLARLVGPTGTVISADLQPEMLQRVAKRAQREGLADRIRTHQCRSDRIGLEQEVDFALAFWMLHEAPDPAGLLAEVYSLLRPGGRFYVIEPGIHVSRELFEEALQDAGEAGFTVVDMPRVTMSRAVVLGRS